MQGGIACMRATLRSAGRVPQPCAARAWENLKSQTGSTVRQTACWEVAYLTEPCVRWTALVWRSSDPLCASVQPAGAPGTYTDCWWAYWGEQEEQTLVRSGAAAFSARAAAAAQRKEAQ